jgi:4-hydroxybenzoate polyprenyltransferase
VAGGTVGRSLALAVAMLGLQFCIGTINDVVDAPLDARTKAWKPIPSGLVGRRSAVALALICGTAALAIPALMDPLLVPLSATMLGAGLAYDVFLKPTRWAWICFAIAFPLLPVYAWYGAVGTLPPRPELLLPLAALAAPALQLANALADLELDARGGIVTPATTLGRERTLLTMAVLLTVLHSVVWLTIGAAPRSVLIITALATSLAVVGVVLSARRSRRSREAGWMVQAVSLACLGVGWLAAVSAGA